MRSIYGSTIPIPKIYNDFIYEYEVNFYKYSDEAIIVAKEPPPERKYVPQRRFPFCSINCVYFL